LSQTITMTGYRKTAIIAVIAAIFVIVALATVQVDAKAKSRQDCQDEGGFWKDGECMGLIPMKPREVKNAAAATPVPEKTGPVNMPDSTENPDKVEEHPAARGEKDDTSGGETASDSVTGDKSGQDEGAGEGEKAAAKNGEEITPRDRAREQYLKQCKRPDCQGRVEPEFGSFSGTGILFLDTEPPGAEVIFDGDSRGAAPLTVKDIKSGDHWLELTMEGYRPHFAYYAADSEGENAKKVTRLEFGLEAPTGIIDVTADSGPAFVTLDGDFKGEAPLRIVDVPQGKHIIVVENDGIEKVVEVEVTPERIKSVEANFQEELGGLTVISDPPEADMYLNGEHRGQTPLTIEALRGGEYDLRLEIEEKGLGRRGIVRVTGGETSVVEWDLESAGASVEIITSPPGAIVLVDSVNKGTTPLKVSGLLPGTYDLMLYRKGYFEEERNLEVAAGKTRRLEIGLRPLECPAGYSFVPSGKFIMGSAEEEQERAFTECERFGGRGSCGAGEYGWFGRQKQHPVLIGDDFCMKKHEVTNAEYMQCVRDGACEDPYSEGQCWMNGERGWNWKPAGELPAEFRQGNRPVVCVSWNMARDYTVWKGGKYRLPTEAEWEYAARAGTDGAWYWGDDADGACKFENFNDFDWDTGLACRDGYSTTAPVASFRPNPWGLHDMLGNVKEWVMDWDGEYPDELAIDPAGPAKGEKRIGRGGTWNTYGYVCSAAYRASSSPERRFAFMGFRLVRSLP